MKNKPSVWRLTGCICLLFISLLYQIYSVQIYILIELVMPSCIITQMLLYLHTGYTVRVHSFIVDSLQCIYIKVTICVHNMNILLWAKQCCICLTYLFSDGMSCSGVFITCMTDIERVLVEGAVDIFQTVKAARAHRPHMVCISVNNP